MSKRRSTPQPADDPPPPSDANLDIYSDLYAAVSWIEGLFSFAGASADHAAAARHNWDGDGVGLAVVLARLAGVAADSGWRNLHAWATAERFAAVMRRHWKPDAAWLTVRLGVRDELTSWTTAPNFEDAYREMEAHYRLLGDERPAIERGELPPHLGCSERPTQTPERPAGDDGEASCRWSDSLNDNEYTVLRALKDKYPILVLLVDLSADTCIAAKTCGSVVNSLIARGLAKRRSSRTGVTITPEGEVMLRRANDAITSA